MKLTRRRFLAATAVVAAGLTTGTSAYLAISDESNSPVVDEIQITLPALHPDLDGFTIAQMSDFHLYPFTQLDLIHTCVDLCNELEPDLIVLTGDFVWRDLDAIHDLAPALGRLQAKEGVYAIVGNHDIWLDVNVIIEALESAGIPVLVNQGVSFQRGGGRLHLAGLDDGWSGNPDLEAAMKGVKNETTTVLLMHEPDLADVYSQDERIALQLSGHSHSGQIRIAGKGALVLPHLGEKYDMGLYSINGMWLYTNRGIGCISEPYRYNCPPEISRFKLSVA